VHLSETVEEAISVARRKTDQPVLLRIAATEAHQSGIAFYHEGKVYLASHIPAQFLCIESLPAASPTPTA